MSEADPDKISGGDNLPRRAIVVPRARREGCESSLPIDRLIADFIRPGVRGILAISAPPGGGKTTALRHLRAVLPALPDLRFFDADQMDDAWQASLYGLAILAVKSADREIRVLETLELCPWTIDDCLEYLAVRHRDQLAGILNRLSNDSSLTMLNGSPELMTLVMAAMAADPSLATAREALRRFVAAAFPFSSIRDELMMVACCGRLGIESGKPTPGQLQKPSLTDDQSRWWRHDAVQRVFLGEWVADQLSQGQLPPCLARMSGKWVLAEIAASTACRPGAIARLERLVANHPKTIGVPMAASILLQVNPAWRPAHRKPLNLAGAILCSAQWARIDLHNAILTDADFTDADLSQADLTQVAARHVRMFRANLASARLDRAELFAAKFMRADLSQATLQHASISYSDFTAANLTLADFSQAVVSTSNLQKATLHRTQFCSCYLTNVSVEAADFTGVNFHAAKIENVAMCQARWDHPVFTRATLLECNLEGLEIPGADFTWADLTGSLFTASRMPGGKFAGAKLIQAGLAEIDWENADLRDADLTNASFHLGSSRSGLVGSIIPSEGSRTGFYTDDYNEQDFKSPEEIRKAALCGVNLLGAKVNRADFYLVDLRGAKYSDDQADHFARCGAILVSRVS